MPETVQAEGEVSDDLNKFMAEMMGAKFWISKRGYWKGEFLGVDYEDMDNYAVRYDQRTGEKEEQGWWEAYEWDLHDNTEENRRWNPVEDMNQAMICAIKARELGLLDIKIELSNLEFGMWVNCKFRRVASVKELALAICMAIREALGEV